MLLDAVLQCFVGHPQQFRRPENMPVRTRERFFDQFFFDLLHRDSVLGQAHLLELLFGAHPVPRLPRHDTSIIQTNENIGRLQETDSSDS